MELFVLKEVDCDYFPDNDEPDEYWVNVKGVWNEQDARMWVYEDPMRRKYDVIEVPKPN